MHATVATTPYPNIPIGLPSEPVGLFLSGYDLSEPSIGVGGLVPPSLPTHHHIPPLPISELEIICFSGYERFEPTIVLGGLATSPLRPTSTIPPPSFPSLIFFLALSS